MQNKDHRAEGLNNQPTELIGPVQLSALECLTAAKTSREVASALFAAKEEGLAVEQIIEAFRIRLETLTLDAQPTSLQPGHPMYFGLFHTDSTVTANMMFGRPTKMKSDCLIKMDTLGQAIQANMQNWTSPEQSHSYLIAVASTATNYFFNSLYPFEAFSGERQSFFESTDDRPDLELEELQGKQFSKCAERAPVLNQYLSLLGFKTATVLGNVKTEGADSSSGHVYNIIKGPTRFVLLDPTNPTLYIKKDKTSGIVSYHPLEREEVEQLFGGGEVAVKRNNFQVAQDGSLTPIEHQNVTYDLYKSRAYMFVDKSDDFLTD